MLIPCLLPEDGVPMQIQAKVFTVGRLQKCHLVIEHPSISKEHTQIRIQDKNYIVDLQSTNGTFINGVRLGKGQQMEINDGDVIQFGKSPVLYTFFSDTKKAYAKQKNPVVKDIKISVLDYVNQKQREMQSIQPQQPQPQSQQQIPVNSNPSDDTQINNAIFQKNMETAQAIIQQLERENNDLRTQTLHQQQDLDRKTQKQLELQFQIEKLTTDNQTLGTKYGSIEPYIKDLQNKLDVCKKEIELYQHELEELKVTDVGKRLSIQLQEIAQLRKILLLRDEENQQLKKQINQLLSNVSNNPQHHTLMLEQNVREMTQMKKLIQEWESRDSECNRKWTLLLKDNAQKEESIRGLKHQIERQTQIIQNLYAEQDKRNYELNKRLVTIIEQHGSQQQQDAALFLVQQTALLQEERRIFVAENEDLHANIQELLTELEYTKNQEYQIDGQNVTQLIVALRQRIEELNDVLNEYKHRDGIDQQVQQKQLIEDLELQLLKYKKKQESLEQQIYTLKNEQQAYQQSGTFDYFSKRINELEGLVKAQQNKLNQVSGVEKEKDLQIDNMKHQLNTIVQFERQNQHQDVFKNERIVV